MEENTETQETSTSTNEKKKVNFLPIIGVVLVIGVGGFLVSSFSNKKSSDISQQPVQQAKPTTAVQGAATTNEEKTFTVEGGNFYFKPNEIKVKKGDKVKITFTNAQGFHDFVIDEFNVKTNRVNGGNTTTAEFIVDKTGTFEYYCSVGKHREMGMKGNLLVE